MPEICRAVRRAAAPTTENTACTAHSELSRRTVLGGLGAAAATGGLVRPAMAKDLVVGFIYVGPKDDYGYNQAHAEAAAMLKKMPGVKIVEEEKVPETDDVSEDHGEHDQAGWRDPAVPHQLRLFRSVHAEDGGQISEHPVPPLRRAVAERQAPDEHRVVFRLYRHGPVPQRHRRRRMRRNRRSSASSPPSRSRRC